MLLEPDFSLLLDGVGLGVRHARGEDRGEILAAFVTTSAGQHGPEVGFVDVLGRAASAPVEKSQLGLRGEVAAFSGCGEPAEGLLLVLGNLIFLVALEVAQAES